MGEGEESNPKKRGQTLTPFPAPALITLTAARFVISLVVDEAGKKRKRRITVKEKKNAVRGVNEEKVMKG